MSNTTSAPFEQTGTTFCRKPKGRKLTFLFGGPTLDEARRYVLPDTGVVFEWHGMDGRVVTFTCTKHPTNRNETLTTVVSDCTPFLRTA